MHAIVVVSGGMDSVTLLHYLANTYGHISALSFDYGQKHVREVHAAAEQAARMGVEHHTIQLPMLGQLTGSAITDANVAMPRGHFSAESMRHTVVPGRNAMMLSRAWAAAATCGASAVATGVHAGDHFIYPDCRPEFIAALQTALSLGTLGSAPAGLHLETPFLYITKTEILRLGLKLGVDYRETWTCYEGREIACGACGACQERLTAFADLHTEDPLDYESRVLVAA